MSDGTLDLNAPEVQSAIKAAVEKATAPLLAKRDELLGEVKKLRKQTDIDPAELEKVESERDELKAQLAEANRTAKSATKAAEEATKKAEAADSSMAKLLVDNGMSEALAKAGVTNPTYQKAARAMLAGQATLVADGDTKVIKIGDKPLSDFVAEWAKGDEGKAFVAATPTSGDGAHNGRPATTTSKSITRAAFDQLDPAARMAHTKAGGTVTD